MNFVPSPHQAAGHDGSMAAGSVFAKRATAQEIEFYGKITAANNSEALGSHVAHWLPSFMGTLTEGALSGVGETPQMGAAPLHHDSQYIVLSNLYYGFSRPCILDIKLGSVLTDDTASAEKRARLHKVAQSTTSGSLAFRICGMKLPADKPRPPPLFENMDDTILEETTAEGKYLWYNKVFGKSLNTETVETVLGHFFHGPLRRELLARFLQRLQLFYNSLLDAEIRVVSGSLLFIYEGDELRWHGLDPQSYLDADPLIAETEVDDDDEVEFVPLSRLNFIDFAHAKLVPGQGPDENIIDGVENLLSIFERLATA